MRRHRDDKRGQLGPQRGRDRSRSRSRDREDQFSRQQPTRRDHRGQDTFGRDIERGRVGERDHEHGYGGSAALSSSQRKSRFTSGSSSQKQAKDEVKGDEKKADMSAGGEEDDEEEMLRMMGFGGFGSSKGKHVDDNDKAAAGAANVTKQRKYRQYMNRREGFNTALANVD